MGLLYPTIGIVTAMPLYNLAAFVLSVSLRYHVGMTGMSLLQRSALAAWPRGALSSD